jgi:hypothetical protein
MRSGVLDPCECGHKLTSGLDSASKRVLANETDCGIGAFGSLHSYVVVARARAETHQYAGVFTAVGEAGQETAEGIQKSGKATSESAKEGGEGAGKSDCEAA